MAAPEGGMPPATRASVERAAFVRDGVVPCSVREEVGESWRRSVGLDATCPADLYAAAAPARTDDLEILVRRLARSALPQALLAHGLVLLLDGEGRVIARWYGDDVGVRTELGPSLGDRLDERAVGTTAVALAAASGVCEQVVGPEHLLPTLVTWTSTASPVLDPSGDVLGYLATLERAAESTVTPVWLQVVTGLLGLEVRRTG